jgi:hypothetical protein
MTFLREKTTIILSLHIDHKYISNNCYLADTATCNELFMPKNAVVHDRATYNELFAQKLSCTRFGADNANDKTFLKNVILDTQKALFVSKFTFLRELF